MFSFRPTCLGKFPGPIRPFLPDASPLLLLGLIALFVAGVAITTMSERSAVPAPATSVAAKHSSHVWDSWNKRFLASDLRSAELNFE